MKPSRRLQLSKTDLCMYMDEGWCEMTISSYILFKCTFDLYILKNYSEKSYVSVTTAARKDRGLINNFLVLMD